MLTLPETVRTKMERLLDQAEQGGSDPIDTARKLIALDPLFAPAHFVLAQAAARAGHLDAAEQQLWTALAMWPCSAFLYFGFAQVRAARNESDALAAWLHNLGLWKLGLSDEIHDPLEEQASEQVPEEGLDPAEEFDRSDPELYEAMAEAGEGRLKENPLTEEDEARLRPYLLLNKLQQGARSVVARETMNGILTHAEECLPVLRGALRTWARGSGQVSEEAGYLIIALLGEIGGADVMEELIELSDRQNGFLHVQWALHRMAERFPEDALAVFRKATPGASVGMRCAIADQIYMMQPVQGLDDALIRLVDHFSQVSRQEAAMPLLLAVVEGLRQLGREEQAGSILGRCRKMLKNRDRQMLDNALEDRVFSPSLVFEGAEGTDIEDVVIERILMDEDDDEGDDEFEEEDQDADHKAGPDTPVTRLMLRIGEFATKGLAFDEMEQAKFLYFGTKGEVEVSQDEINDFMTWTILEFRGTRSGLTAIELFLTESVRPKLTLEERRLAEALAKAHYGLFEVLHVDRGRGLQVKDHYTGQTEFIPDVSSSNEAQKGDSVLTRVFVEGDGTKFVGNGIRVPPEMRLALHEWIAEESKAAGQPEAEFVRANSYRVTARARRLHVEAFPMPQLVTPEGDSMEFSSATYEVINAPEVIARLRKMEEMIENSGRKSERSFGWVEPGTGPRRALGDITISDGCLILQCISRERLKQGRRLLEIKLGASVKHVEDTFEPVAEAMKKRST